MGHFYAAGVQAALEKLGGSFLGRLSGAAREGLHEVPRAAEKAMPMVNKAKRLSPEARKQLSDRLAKKTYLPGANFPS